MTDSGSSHGHESVGLSHEEVKSPPSTSERVSQWYYLVCNLNLKSCSYIYFRLYMLLSFKSADFGKIYNVLNKTSWSLYAKIIKVFIFGGNILCLWGKGSRHNLIWDSIWLSVVIQIPDSDVRISWNNLQASPVYCENLRSVWYMEAEKRQKMGKPLKHPSHECLVDAMCVELAVYGCWVP